MSILRSKNDVLIIALLLLTACDSGNGPLSQPRASGTVVLQFYTDRGLSVPYDRGLQVIVYGDDHQTIDRVFQVDASGEANLGAFDSDVSLSLIYENEVFVYDEESGIVNTAQAQHIRSILDYPLASLEQRGTEFLLRLHNDSANLTSSTPVARNLTVTVNAGPFSNLSPSVVGRLQAGVQPQFYESAGFGVFGLGPEDCPTNLENGVHVLLDGELSSGRIQQDGAVSLLSLIGHGFGPDIALYGFSLDQPVANNVDYRLTADLVPLRVGVDLSAYESSTSDQGVAVSLFGVRRGVRYYLSSTESVTFDERGIAQSVHGQSQSACFGGQTHEGFFVHVADQFPVDTYVSSTFEYQTRTTGPVPVAGFEQTFSAYYSSSCKLLSSSESLPSPLVLSPLRSSLTSVAFDANALALSWEGSGQNQTNSARLVLSAQDGNYLGTWSIDFSPVDSRLELPTLPDGVLTIVRDKFALPVREISLQTYDYVPSLFNSATGNDSFDFPANEARTRCTASQFSFEETSGF